MFKTFLATIGILLTLVTIGQWANVRAADKPSPAKVRRILYNSDGDSCMWTKKNGHGPVAVTAADLKPAPADEDFMMVRPDYRKSDYQRTE